ncbi:hypothetical protein ACGFNU_44175 [Spirillospora sp. NPDC048911]|uniref:hypothetical protein n=1 Tax=Spirillospora sp. NPDC048911 TaxID=3364527 RepID=UPI00370FC715
MTRQRTFRQPQIADLLETAHRDLTQAVSAISPLLASAEGYLSWGSAQCEATLARDAVRRAPSLPAESSVPQDDQSTTSPATGSLAMRLRSVATTTERTLLRAADIASDVDDTLACLTAALHCARLRDALR